LILSSSCWNFPQAIVASHKADSVDFNIAPVPIGRSSSGCEWKEKGKETTRVVCFRGRGQGCKQKKKRRENKVAERMREVWPFGTLSRQELVVWFEDCQRLDSQTWLSSPETLRESLSWPFQPAPPASADWPQPRRGATPVPSGPAPPSPRFDSPFQPHLQMACATARLFPSQLKQNNRQPH
jgi:hypothetical protein